MEIDYDQLADKIAAKLIKAQHATWGTDECAEFLQCSVKHFRDRVAKRPGFPNSVPGSRGRWYRDAVIQWASKAA